MPKSAIIQVRTDKQTKDKAGAIFEELGMTTSSAVNVFLKKVIKEGGIPFDLVTKEMSGTASYEYKNELLAEDEEKQVRKSMEDIRTGRFRP